MSDQSPVPPVPPGPPSAAPAASDPLGRLLRAVPGRDWVAAVVAALGGWVAAYVVAAISLFLTVAVAAAGSGPVSTGSSSGLGTGGSDLGSAGAPDVQSLLSGVSVLLGSPAQLVALADLGRLHGSGSILLLGSGSGSVGVVPVLVLAAQVVLAVVLTRRIRSRVLALPQLVVTAVVAGLVTTAVTTLAGLVLAIRFPAVSGVQIDPVHAVGIGSVLGSFVIGTLAVLLARPSLLVGRSTSVARALGALRVAAWQLGGLLVLLALVLVVVALVAQPSWGAALPLLLGNAAVALTALGFLGGVGTSGLGAVGSDASVFAGAGGWTWLVVLLVVVSSFVAGLALAVRRNDRVRTTLDWVATPVVWFVAGLVLFVLGTGVVSYQVTGSSAVGGSGSVGVTPWTPVVFALWGGAIEVVARYVAPVLLPRVGGGVLLRTARVVGTDPVLAPVPAPVPARPTAPVDGAAPVWAVPADAAAPAAPAAMTDPSQPDQPVEPDAPVGQPHPSQPFVGQGAPAPAPMSPRAKKVLVRSLIAGGAVVVVVVAGAITTGVLRTTVWGPGPTARSYVDAIAQGDADTAASLSEVTGDASMLDSAVLQSAKDRPTDVRVGRVSTSGDTAYANVTFRQGDAQRSGQIVLERTGTSFLVKDEWRVTEPLTDRVTITAGTVLEGADVTIGGKKVGEIENGAFTSLAYPGSYQVEVGGTEYFTGGTETLRVGSSSSPYADFEAKPTKELETDAEQYVSDLIDDCAAKTDISYADGCPWYGPYDADGADGAVQYDVRSKPDLEVQSSGGGLVEVTSTADGRIGYSYTDYFGDAQKSEDTFDVDVYLKVEDGKLVSAY
ncbi:hypothetical protein [Curtobacterium sp. YR515]|uniref:hypothetical protein n=1 Tax=Curtobacterium sp. YR515 TaxID=1855316 RepID=UPI0008F0CFA3|nr:hypothetical protein [Curtobacterium sp. YR515]SFF67924.1 hypothetical protein SAMN05216329_2288 [Curtobacterium sp. YR515]